MRAMHAGLSSTHSQHADRANLSGTTQLLPLLPMHVSAPLPYTGDVRHGIAEIVAPEPSLVRHCCMHSSRTVSGSGAATCPLPPMAMTVTKPTLVTPTGMPWEHLPQFPTAVTKSTNQSVATAPARSPPARSCSTAAPLHHSRSATQRSTYAYGSWYRRFAGSWIDLVEILAVVLVVGCVVAWRHA
jgi:hypothetical protein